MFLLESVPSTSYHIYFIRPVNITPENRMTSLQKKINTSHGLLKYSLGKVTSITGQIIGNFDFHLKICFPAGHMFGMADDPSRKFDFKFTPL
jgi:hypothetical protein